MSCVPFGQRRGLIYVLNDPSPSTAVIGGKADLPSLARNGDTRAGHYREIIVKEVLEPHTIDHQEPPPTTIGITLR